MTALAAAERATLLGLARAAIADGVREAGDLARLLATAPLTAALRTPRGAFVTLQAAGGAELRGCIGTLEAQDPLFDCVIRNAANAAFRDPRFPPVTAEELTRLRIEISALEPLRRVPGPEEIRIGRDGVELRRGSSHAVFLPHVAIAQGWDVERLLEQLARKAGLAADGWRGAELRVFQAEVFGEG